MADEPTPIGPDIDTILDGILPEHLARGRVRLLREQADAVLTIRDIHRRAWEEMVGREVRVLVCNGMSPKAAEQAATNNLAVRKRELDGKLDAELTRLKGERGRKLKRLLEDAEDGRDDGGETPAA